MAYVAFAEAPHAGPVTAAPVEIYRAAPPAAVPTPAFSALEWSVVAIAERDGLPSLREPGRVAVALGTLFGEPRPTPRLADPRREALRRIAVLSWHFGYTVPGKDVDDFVAAGFSYDHYELLVDSISVAQARARRNRKHQ